MAYWCKQPGFFHSMPGTSSVVYSLWFIPSAGVHFLVLCEHTVQCSRRAILREQPSNLHQVLKPPRCICRMSEFKLSLILGLYTWGWVFRRSWELWSSKALYFVSDIIIPAWPPMILKFVGKHHLSLIIEKWEEEVHIPIDNTCTVPACVTISCVLPRPIWKPTR